MAAIEQAIASGAVQPPAAPGLPSTVAVPVTPPQQFTTQPTPPPAYLPVYASSSLVPSGATTVTIAGGDERAGVDIQTRLAQASQIQGTVATPVEPGVAVQVSLHQRRPDAGRRVEQLDAGRSDRQVHVPRDRAREVHGLRLHHARAAHDELHQRATRPAHATDGAASADGRAETVGTRVRARRRAVGGRCQPSAPRRANDFRDRGLRDGQAA